MLNLIPAILAAVLPVYWQDGRLNTRDDIYRSGQYWQTVTVVTRGDAIVIDAVRYGEEQGEIDGGVEEFSLTQTTVDCRASIVANAEWSYCEQDVTLLRLRHPEVAACIDGVFEDAALPDFVMDPVTQSRCADGMRPAPSASEKVAAILPQLASQDWRERDYAERQLVGLGADGAIAMLAVDRDGLTPEQGLQIDRVLSRWPHLTPTDIARFKCSRH